MVWFSESNVVKKSVTFWLPGAFYVGLLDGLLGVAGIIIDSDYGSFPKLPCELSTSKMMQGWNKQNRDFHSTDMGIVSCNAQCSKPVQADDYLRLYYWLAASTRLGTIVVIVKLDTSILISQCNFSCWHNLPSYSHKKVCPAYPSDIPKMPWNSRNSNPPNMKSTP
jgi:hypothetical protein